MKAWKLSLKRSTESDPPNSCGWSISRHPTVTPQELIRVSKNLKISRALFAVYLRTNVRTLENWEQGRAKPNAQASLINLAKRYPDTVQKDRHHLVAAKAVDQSMIGFLNVAFWSYLKPGCV